MTGLRIHQEQEAAGRITLRLEGTLDGRTAQELRNSLQALGQSEVVLDFAHLREFKDSAVGVLTHGLKEGAVELRGLATHHERMFRYFGVLSSPTTHRAYYTPEDILSV
ncbi:STAS domain-containing protein [Corallococcus macrosporus]|uniref:STAS domain-containing protein n=1 Tax=Corallococcus macrosporus TaxID=35 RepID=A0ABS3D5G0_9BACT|nr:STAS domain-containing protein [Corallococcus macrosporus]MBN8226911.1 STAS domain-containing protein [Corallococcus macrosporus]